MRLFGSLHGNRGQEELQARLRTIGSMTELQKRQNLPREGTRSQDLSKDAQGFQKHRALQEMLAPLVVGRNPQPFTSEDFSDYVFT